MSAFFPTLGLALSLISSAIPPIGTTVAGFELADARGEVRRLEDWRSSRLVVLVFLKVDCPVSELYGSPISGLANDFKARGVAFIGIAPDGPEAAAELSKFATEHEVSFVLLRDGWGALAAGVGATRTPEVVVLDEDRAIRYRGRIDDRYSVGSRRAEPRQLDLSEALEALLGGRPVPRPETEPVGCPIDRPVPPFPAAGVTYSRDVAPILRRRCADCHRPGQVGPFPLLTYRQAARWAGAIGDAVEDGRMPPWHADPRFGTFANDCRLTDRERRLITDWAEGGAPEGNPDDLPPPASFPEGWRIPEPDVVASMSAPFQVPAGGVVDYQAFEVDPGFLVDTWVRAAEIRPGNRKVVHHCNVFLKAPGSRGDMDTAGELGSYCLAAMTPGSPPMILPEGMAKRIPAGWKLVFVVHYSPIGTPQDDRSCIGLVLADPASVRKEVATNLLFDPDLRIPARASNHRVERTRRFDEDVLLLAMFPHMHLRGKSFRYEAIYPDGREEILLDVPRYDFRWQNRYELAEPRRLPAGTTLRCVAHFDNSAGNTANPDPDAIVLVGKQSWEEMFNGYYDIALADQDLTRPVPWWRAIAGQARKSLSDPGRVGGLACGIAAWALWRRMRLRRAKCRTTG